MQDATRRRFRFLVGFALYFGTIWFLWDTPILYPLKVFVVLLHEISHAMTAVATGGYIERIALDPRQGGACYCPGGNAFLTLSAGYLGSLAWGAALLLLARSKKVNPRILMGVIGLMILSLTVLYVRTPFGILFGILFGAVLLTASRRLSIGINRKVLIVLGLTSCLYAILDIKSDVLDRPELQSDAAMLADLTGIPTLAWGAIWITLALGVSGLLFWKAFREA